ncbi:MAG: class SAM-dependent methyltransferase [Clostridia bacterium]|jgi:SAM-dependent methyltransferase|nr:class SAM-dependent methyltransferase [Clostridia bacterium]
MIINELKLYQRSVHSIWTDEYISKGMLAAHLNLDNDAASRNIKTIEKTVDWIIERIPEGGKVLDLGCGPGLYSSLLARKGYSVTGIDISQHSISYAKSKAAEDKLQIYYYCADYIKEDIGKGYDAAICIYCDFGALIPDEQAVFLNKVHHALSDNGILILDVFKTGLCDNKQESRDWYFSESGGFWCSRPHLILDEVKHFPAEKVWGARTVIIEEGKSPREYITWDNYYTEDDIKRVLDDNGFYVLSINNELVAENEFTSSDVMFIEAKKKTRV